MRFKSALAILTMSSLFMASSPAFADIIQLEPAQPAVVQQASLPEIHFSAKPAMDQATTVFGLPLNMGPIDRSLRGVLALGLIGTGIYGLASGQINTPLSATLIGVGLIPTATAATGYCPLYQVFGLKYSF